MATHMRGLASLRRKLGLLTPAEESATRVEVKRALLNIQNDAKKRVKVDRGDLRNSIAHETRNGGLKGRVGTNKEHGPPVEFGRRAGKMPPLSEIRAWARRKGIDEGAAFAIAKKIATEGTPAAPFLFPSLEAERRPFMARLSRALDEANRKVSRS